jgi:protocatechuate 3,4-dioxygenase beta subunit
MKPIFLILLLTIILYAGCSQSHQREKKVGDGCEDCELMFEGMPDKLQWKTTLTAATEPGEPLIIRGTIFKKDGKTPAPGIILYVYQTDAKGLYSPLADQKNGKKHGHLRGWMKTNDQGQYEFKTIRPASYPGSRIPQHIHPIIKEPGLSIYWIDDFLFSDDPFLNDQEKSNLQNRGGSGILTLKKDSNGVWLGERNITLGLSVPNY